MPKPEVTPGTRVPNDPKALTPEYHKAHKQVMLWSAILLFWELVGIDLEKAQDAGGHIGSLLKSIKSPQAVPWVLVILVGYFLFKVTVEWYQCNQERRTIRVSMADILSAWSVSLLSYALYVYQAINRVQFADGISKTNLGILVGIAGTQWLFLMYQFYSESQGDMLRVARKIWIFLVLLCFGEWAIGNFFFLLLPSVGSSSLSRWISSVLAGVLAASIPIVLEAVFLGKDGVKGAKLQTPLRILVRKLGPRYNFAWWVETCREQDLYDSQIDNGWLPGLTSTEVGRRLRMLYEICKVDIAAKRADDSFLRFDVGRIPQEKFYLLVRHLRPKWLRRAMTSDLKWAFKDWDGSERRRRENLSKDDRDPAPDTAPTECRVYDNEECSKLYRKTKQVSTRALRKKS